MLLVALAIDVIVGELPTAIHPVVWVGNLIRVCERRLPRNGKRALVAGIGMAIVIPAIAVCSSWFSLEALSAWPLAQAALSILLLTSSFSLRMLGREAQRVAWLLEQGRLGDARRRVSYLCSRDSSALSEGDVAAATIESVAENTSDAFVAPLFWFAVLGLPGAILFRTVNTLDSMIGYRGEYEFLGKASAKLDDILCWIPARITAGLLLISGPIFRGDFRRGLAVALRDGGLTPSPNAGRPMAAMGGLLGVRLDKPGVYLLSGEGREPNALAVSRSVSISRCACGLVVLILLSAETLAGDMG